jgi:hypothetical protein
MDRALTASHSLNQGNLSDWLALLIRHMSQIITERIGADMRVLSDNN